MALSFCRHVQLKPFLDDGRTVRLEGPEVLLNARAALMLGLAVHELATNASKYGAFSRSGGSVSVVWNTDKEGTLVVSWREAGGPAVTKPTGSGFGRTLLERALVQDLRGDVHLLFEPGGVHCALTIPSLNYQA
jgi:two-component sensor histidine kinase